MATLLCASGYEVFTPRPIPAAEALREWLNFHGISPEDEACMRSKAILLPVWQYQQALRPQHTTSPAGL